MYMGYIYNSKLSVSVVMSIFKVGEYCQLVFPEGFISVDSLKQWRVFSKVSLFPKSVYHQTLILLVWQVKNSYFIVLKCHFFILVSQWYQIKFEMTPVFFLFTNFTKYYANKLKWDKLSYSMSFSLTRWDQQYVIQLTTMFK